MLNANRIFFIIVKKGYEAFDFAGPRFIQRTIRKASAHRACFARMRKHLTTNGTPMDTKVKNPENGATGKSNIEGKTATGSSERSGSRASFNHGSNGLSRIEFRHHDFRPVSFSKHSCHPRQPWSSSLLSVNIRPFVVKRNQLETELRSLI